MAGSCHGGGGEARPAGLPKVVLIGSPNVGKSVLFNLLTGAYVTVSNYPGTTVEVSRGRGRIGECEFEVIDTPGMYSLLGISEEEQVSRRLLWRERPDLVLHVVEARTLDRSLSLTLQLLEAGLPVILVVNVLDEARRLGLWVDLDKLSHRLGIPVVGTTAIRGQGVDLLNKTIVHHLSGRAVERVAV